MREPDFNKNLDELKAVIEKAEEPELIVMEAIILGKLSFYEHLLHKCIQPRRELLDSINYENVTKNRD